MRPRFSVTTAVITLGLCLVAAGCSEDSSPLGPAGGNGQVHFVLSSTGTPTLNSAPASATTATSAPGGSAGAAATPLVGGAQGPGIKSAKVTFSSILARNLQGQLVSCQMTLPMTVDMLTVMNGRSMDLPAGFLPPGTYDQIVVVMTSLEIVTADDASHVITPPGGGWTVVRNMQPFTVIEGQVTTIELTMKLDHAFHWMGDHFGFEPDFDCHRM
jgi:hypothetical protein